MLTVATILFLPTSSQTHVGLRNYISDGGAHQCHLVSTIE